MPFKKLKKILYKIFRIIFFYNTCNGRYRANQLVINVCKATSNPPINIFRAICMQFLSVNLANNFRQDSACITFKNSLRPRYRLHLPKKLLGPARDP